MESGVNGKNGPCVAQPVGLVPRLEPVNATNPRRNMAESALGTDKKQKLVWLERALQVS